MTVKKDNTMMIALVAGAGLLFWQMSKGKTPLPAPSMKPPTLPPPTVPPPGVKPQTLPPKTPVIENPTMPLEVWQGLTGEEIAQMPVTREMGNVGYEDYYKTSAPYAIGDTDFSIWGMTESGSPVVAQNDPASYAAWEWL